MIKLYENFTDVQEIKETIFRKAVDTNQIDIVKFFLKKGYNINSENAIVTASYYDDMFRFFLKKNANIDDLKHDDRLMDLDVQKALMDFGHEVFINDNAEFNYKLRNIPEYAKIINRFEEMGKYNL